MKKPRNVLEVDLYDIKNGVIFHKMDDILAAMLSENSITDMKTVFRIQIELEGYEDDI